MLQFDTFVQISRIIGVTKTKEPISNDNPLGSRSPFYGTKASPNHNDFAAAVTDHGTGLNPPQVANAALVASLLKKSCINCDGDHHTYVCTIICKKCGPGPNNIFLACAQNFSHGDKTKRYNLIYILI